MEIWLRIGIDAVEPLRMDGREGIKITKIRERISAYQPGESYHRKLKEKDSVLLNR